MNKDKKEFIIYESIFSDILGILFFNAVVNNPTFEIQSAAWIVGDFVLIIFISIIFTGLVLVFINKTTMNIKFFLLIAVLVLLYAFGKMIHMSSLLMILIFGLIFNNLNFVTPNRLLKYINVHKLHDGIDRFKMITNESAFLIRTFFFFIFGFTLQLAILGNLRVLISGIIIAGILYVIRFLYLKFMAHRNLYPELYIAPRGLITIILFYAIPEEYRIGIISEGVLFMVVLLTSFVMMLGLFKSKEQIPEMEIYVGEERIDDVD